MGIRITHIIIISFSILLAGYFSYQMYVEDTIYLFVAGLISTVGLSYYMSIIIKKFQTL
jgi:hypothetical protein